MSLHSETWDLIPWLVNGRAADADRKRVETHLRDCAACRNELDLQQRVRAAMAQDTGIEQLPSASLQRLLAKIDAQEEAPQIASSRDAADSRSALSRWLVAAVIVESIGLMLLSATLWRKESSQATASPYYTITSPAPVARGAVIRAVFSPQLPLRELHTLLAASHLKIVAGPTEAGVYSLALPAAADRHAVESALIALRTHSGVRFAEPIVELHQ